ncbi:MAG: bifunctional enzyme MurC/Ddl [Chlamydiota bacterium]|jgi:UDP-N-acetylmuramate--alanine ligase
MEQSYHFIGIGGIGMSALASILIEKGIKVSGSDAQGSYMIDRLKDKGAEITIGHAAENIKNPTAVVFSTAIREDNPEVIAARQKKVPFIHRSELLRQLMKESRALLVTGTHGKTTTSSLLAHTLTVCNLKPSYAIGGVVQSLSANGGYGTGEYFVAEADESDGSFLRYTPFGAIITNIDNDHLDHWQTMDDMVAGFEQFADSVTSKEHLFFCGDDDKLVSLDLEGYSYGFGETNDLYIKNFIQEGWKSTFDCTFEGKEYTDIAVPLVGAHNVLNASAVFGLGLKLKVKEECLRKAFLEFRGITRRAECKGEINGITILDDYAHHPSEIFATLHALKNAIGKRRLVVLFQPHRYTRTRDCFHEFTTAFQPSDLLVLTDIYAASEAPIPGITTQALVEQMQKSSTIDVRYCPFEELTAYMQRFLKPQDLCVTMGAGNITQIGPAFLKGG